MLSHSRIKQIRALQQKKYRLLHGSFLVEGDKIVRELLHSNIQIIGLYALSGWLEQHKTVIPPGIDLCTVSPAELSRISGQSAPNQVLAVAAIPTHDKRVYEAHHDLMLYLDRIQDPGNLGTIIRTADWFGVRQIFCSPDTTDVYSPKVVQASMGSFMRVSVMYEPLPTALGKLRRKPVVYGAALHGENLFSHPLEKPAMLVVGNESQGISKQTSSLINTFLHIPGKRSDRMGHGMSDSKESWPQECGAESLNASIAAAIMMSWFVSGNEQSG